MDFVSLLIKPASGACNMKCKYCFYEDELSCRKEGIRGIMTAETAEKVISAAAQAAEKGCNFMFQGGEPTLAGLDFYRTFLALEKNYPHLSFSHSIQTNGYALDEEWVTFFRDNGFFVGISLDGNSDLHDLNRLSKHGSGTHSRVMRAIRLLEKHKVEFNILSVITSRAAKSAEKTYNFFKKQGLCNLQFIDCLDAFDGNTSFSADNGEYFTFLDRTFRLWVDDLEKGRHIRIRQFDNWMNMLLGGEPEACNMCGHCSVQFVVESDGSVYPCDFYALDEWKIGDIGTDSLEAMFSSAVAQSFLRESLRVPAECRDCMFYPLCRNGCRRERELLHDSGYGKYRRCEALRQFFTNNSDDISRALAALKSGR